MNAVEIEEAVTTLAEQPFDAAEFPYAFLQTFGNKETTLKRLRKGESNKSDVGGVLQNSNIRGGSVCLNGFRAAVKWISALVTPPPGLASAG